MNVLEIKLIFAGAFFLFVVLTGLWLKIKGLPYGVHQITIHKLLSLVMIAFLVLSIISVDKISGINSTHRILLIVAILSAAGSLATGAILASNKQIRANLVKCLHTIFWALMLGSVSYLLYQLIYYG